MEGLVVSSCSSSHVDAQPAEQQRSQRRTADDDGVAGDAQVWGQAGCESVGGVAAQGDAEEDVVELAELREVGGQVLQDQGEVLGGGRDGREEV